jgi:hypothetical protein
MEIFEGVASVAGGVDASGKSLKSVETFDQSVWTLNPDGMSLTTERSRFIKVYVSQNYIQIPT